MVVDHVKWNFRVYIIHFRNTRSQTASLRFICTYCSWSQINDDDVMTLTTVGVKPRRWHRIFYKRKMRAFKSCIIISIAYTFIILSLAIYCSILPKNFNKNKLSQFPISKKVANTQTWCRMHMFHTMIKKIVQTVRKIEYPINPIIIGRWKPGRKKSLLCWCNSEWQGHPCSTTEDNKQKQS